MTEKLAWYDLLSPVSYLKSHTDPIVIAHHTRVDAPMSIEWIEKLGQGYAVSGDELARARRGKRA